MKFIKLSLMLITLGSIGFGAVSNFSMSYVGTVAVSETSAFYYRYYILDNARLMVDTLWQHFQITENNLGTWSHQSSQLWSRANCDDENFQALNGYVTAHGDTNICLFEYDSAAGTVNHKGFYSVIVSRVNNLIFPDSARYCTLRVVARIDTSHEGDYPKLTWRKARYDTATYDSINLDYNPIMGYAIYRSDDGITGWTRLIPNNASGVINAYTDTTHIDSAGVAGPYFYALRLVYAPTLRIVGTDTLWILSKLSQNSAPIAIIGIEEQGSAGRAAPVTVNPNPARGQVVIKIGQAAGHLRVYDASGKLVRTLPAEREVVWNGADDAGLALPSGIYFIELETEHNKYTGKVILQR